jgi:hypothetical protein
MRLRILSTLAFLATATSFATLVHAATPEAKCQATKNALAGRYASCLARAEYDMVVSDNQTRYDREKADCAARLAAGWRKAEERAIAAGAPCPTSDDVAAVQSQAVRFADAVAGLIGNRRYRDNGDGTITDFRTGLMWEKKTTAVGSGENYADPHDVDNFYAPTDRNRLYDNGRLASQFLQSLNGVTTDGLTFTGCFAGHCDWRMPTSVELYGIVDANAPGCWTAEGPDGPACIDPIFGTTYAEGTWSSTTEDVFSNWFVHFARPDFVAININAPGPVRAVRNAW